MFCIHCGALLPDDAKFCSKCGRPTQAHAQANPPPPPPPIAPVESAPDMGGYEFRRRPVPHKSSALSTLSKVVVGLVILLIIGIAGRVGRDIAKSKLIPYADAVVQDETAKKIMQLNTGLPKMLDTETRADRVQQIDERNLVFFYTLVNYRADEIDDALLNERLETVRQQWCALLRKHGDQRTTIGVSYSDKTGKVIRTFNVNQGTCSRPIEFT